MAGETVNVRYDFTPKQISDALIEHYSLPENTKVDFVVEKVYAHNQTDSYGTMKFTKASARFEKVI